MALKAKERAKRGDEVRTIERRDELPPLTVSSQPIDSSCEKDPEVAARRLVVNFPSTESLQIGSFLRRKSFNDFHSHIYFYPSDIVFRFEFHFEKKITTIIVVSSSFLLFFFFFFAVHPRYYLDPTTGLQISSADTRLDRGARFARSMGHFTGVISTLR